MLKLAKTTGCKVWEHKLRFLPSTNRPYHAIVVGAAASCAVSLLLLAAGALIPSAAHIGVSVGVFSALAVVTVNTLILSRHRGILNDIHAAVELEGALRRCHVPVENFFYDGAAATSGFELMHLKVLLLTQPRCILELGSGQSTKLISHYQQQHPDAYAITLEQDEDWWNRMLPHVTHDYRHSPLVDVTWSKAEPDRSVATSWYDVDDNLLERRFDYVVVDGPDHGLVPYSRSGLLKFIPQLLSPSFTVIFDDAERPGEIDTIKEFVRLLERNGVAFTRFAIRGVKTQEVFCSPDKSFLQSV